MNAPGNKAKLSVQTPETFALHQNYPNPFNPVTTITFALPQAQKVELKIFSFFGQEIITRVNGVLEKGFHQVEWNGKDASGRQVASGIYLYRLKAGGNNLVKKMMLLK